MSLIHDENRTGSSPGDLRNQPGGANRQMQGNPLNSAPTPPRSRPGGKLRLAGSFTCLLLLALLLAGCRNRRAQPAPTHQPAPTAALRAAANFATPTPRAAPPATSPPPSPTPPPPATAEPLTPASLLERAAYLHRIGDYSHEQQLLETALAANQTEPAQPRETPAGAPVQARSALLYQLALAYLAGGQPAAALDALERLQRLGDLLPADSAGPQPDGGADAVAQRMIDGIFLRAEALAAVGRHAEAVAAYRAFLEKRPRLIDVVEESVADAWLAAGELSPAAGALRHAANHAVNRREQTRLLDRLAGVLEDMERWNEAASVYDEILNNPDSDREGPDPDEAFPDRDDLPGFSQWPIYRAGYLYRAGIAYATAGDEETAVARWKSALTAEPASEAAYFSLVQLVNRNLPVDLFLRGEVSLFAQAYLPATYAFERLLDESPQDARAGEAWLGIARAQMGLQQWTAARFAIEQVLESHPDCACFGDAWLTLAQLAFAEGAPAEGRRIYRAFARQYPADPLAPQALWLSARSSLEAGAPPAGVAPDPFDEAVADLLTLASAFPGSNRAAAGLALAGIGAFERGRYAQAANTFRRLLTHYPNAQPDFATYWLGRARHAQGEIAAARSLWLALAARAPESYYGVLAALEADAHQPGQDFVPRIGATVKAVPALPGDDGSRAFAENWLQGPHGFPAAQWGPSQSVTGGPILVKGELLVRLGRRVEGLYLLELVYWQYLSDPAALYSLMLRFDALGANRLAIAAANRLIELSPARRIAAAPLFLQRVAYPRHFVRLVETNASDFGLDPRLLYSLILQESLFEPLARSYAGALGLAQIIPSTGAEIAQRLNYPNYSTELLNLPIVNIRFGAFYLRWARDIAHNNDVAALAGYNAGPGKAYTWFYYTAPDEALFIYKLPYTETGRYLRRVLTHYYHYTRLYTR